MHHQKKLQSSHPQDLHNLYRLQRAIQNLFPQQVPGSLHDSSALHQQG